MVFQYDVGKEFEIVIFLQISKALKKDLDTLRACKQWYPVQYGTCNKMRVCRFVDFVAASSHFISSLHGSFHMHSQRGRWERGKGLSLFPVPQSHVAIFLFLINY